MTNGGENASSRQHVYNGVGTVPWNTTHVNVASSVTVIPERAFEDLPHLQEVKLPEGLIVIGGRAFYHCISLKRVNIPTTVKEIGKEAFAWCDKLETVRLPEGLEVLGSYAFRVCKSLLRVNIPPGVKSIKMGTFLDCCSLTEVSLTHGLLDIGQSAFRGCKSLVSINLTSVRVVGDLAFENCKGLNEIHLPDTVESIGTETFHNCMFQNFHVPPRVTKVDIGIFTRKNCLVSLELSENVKRIEDSVASTSFNFLRNVAFDCQVNTGVFGRCQDLGMAFPSGSSDAISDALKHRFDDLPIHKICYYQSYHPTEDVMHNLKREINPWTLTYPPGQLNATGKQQDCLGMTPLHILACSTKQNVEMYRLLIEKYPETLIMKDKWGDIPLVYAVWCNAPMDIIQLLIESYKSYYPRYVFDWGGMIQTLAKGNALLANIQNLINTQQCSFHEQSYDMDTVVMELALSDARQATFHRPCTCVETFQYLLRASMANRLDSLDVKRWFIDLERGIDALYERPANYRNFDTRVLYAQLELYESAKEATSVLELTLWKTKINEVVSTSNGKGKIAEVGDEISPREQCRINCGANIVVHNVLPYLLPK